MTFMRLHWRKGLLGLVLYLRIGTIVGTLGRKRRFRLKWFGPQEAQ